MNKAGSKEEEDLTWGLKKEQHFKQDEKRDLALWTESTAEEERFIRDQIDPRSWVLFIERKNSLGGRVGPYIFTSYNDYRSGKCLVTEFNLE